MRPVISDRAVWQSFLFIFLIASGCAVTPPAPPLKPVVLSEAIDNAKARMEQALSQLGRADIARRVAMQATENAFAAEHEAQQALIKALEEGDSASIEHCGDKAGNASEALRRAVEQASGIIRQEAEARTSYESAERAMKRALKAEIEQDALTELDLVNAELEKVDNLTGAAIENSEALKSIWLVRDTQSPPSTNTAAQAGN